MESEVLAGAGQAHDARDLRRHREVEEEPSVHVGKDGCPKRVLPVLSKLLHVAPRRVQPDPVLDHAEDQDGGGTGERATLQEPRDTASVVVVNSPDRLHI
jgi:hypothetical protein